MLAARFRLALSVGCSSAEPWILYQLSPAGQYLTKPAGLTGCPCPSGAPGCEAAEPLTFGPPAQLAPRSAGHRHRRTGSPSRRPPWSARSSCSPAVRVLDIEVSTLKRQKPQHFCWGFCGCRSLTMSYFHTGIRTIIGAEAFHCPVRDGKEWDHLAMVIRHNLLPSRLGLDDQFIEQISLNSCIASWHNTLTSSAGDCECTIKVIGSSRTSN